MRVCNSALHVVAYLVCTAAQQVLSVMLLSKSNTVFVSALIECSCMNRCIKKGSWMGRNVSRFLTFPPWLTLPSMMPGVKK